MKSLHIEDTSITLSIDDDESRLITFDPGDTAFVTRFYGLYDKVRDVAQRVDGHNALARKCMKAAKTDEERISVLQKHAKFMNDATLDFYKDIDSVFGEGTCKTVFGDTVSLAACTSFFQQLQQIITENRKGVIDKYSLDEKLSEDGAVLE